MSSAPFLIWFFCIGVSALMIGTFIRTGGLKNTVKKEGFEDGDIQITTCPEGSAQYINSEGDTNCCNGDIVNGECNGTNLCSLSPTSKSVISCSQWLREEWRRRAARFCPGSMYNYFGTMSRTTGTEGCSASRCNRTGSAPSDANAAKCTIYKTDELNYGKADSCVNIVERDRLQCPQANATKQIIEIGHEYNGKIPALLICNYIPANNMSDNMPVECYDHNRYSRALRHVYKNNGEEATERVISLYNQYYQKHIMFCPASKAYYVDKTLTRENAWGLPGPPAAAPACPTK